MRMTDLSLGPLAALARTSTHAVLVEDDQRRVLFANEAFGEAFGVDVVGFVGADCAAAMRESAPLFEEPEAFVARIEALLEAKALVVGDVVRLRDDLQKCAMHLAEGPQVELPKLVALLRSSALIRSDQI